MAEALIRQRIEDTVKAIGAKDIDGVMAFYTPDIVSFDLGPPLRYAGADKNVAPGKTSSLSIRAPSSTKSTT